MKGCLYTFTIRLFCCCMLLLPFAPGKPALAAKKQGSTVHCDTMLFLDAKRNREIPVAIYEPRRPKKDLPVIILSHGYGQNQPGSYKAYSYLANALAAKGYYVVSIQHELPDDPLLPMTGNIRETRTPNWERGVENILFILQRIPKWRSGTIHPVLIGHSNGGDMSMLFAHKYPDIPKAVISLDNRRMPLPRLSHPRIASLRSSDQPADSAVIPTPAEQALYHIRIIPVSVPHNEMDDDANQQQRKEITTQILHVLRDL